MRFISIICVLTNLLLFNCFRIQKLVLNAFNQQFFNHLYRLREKGLTTK